MHTASMRIHALRMNEVDHLCYNQETVALKGGADLGIPARFL